jgi:hypothetical protein
VGGSRRELLGNRQHPHLLGRQPGRELALEVLDQHAHESLHRSERRTVDHHRPVRLVVGAGVAQVEPLGQVVVHLHRAELPLAADHVLHHEVDLRPVERGLAGSSLKDAERLRRLAQRLLGLVPVLRLADVLVAVRIAQPTRTR